MFPEKYTEFLRKIDANWDGDPSGDYVMAEDVNEMQEAIERLEKYLGISSDTSSSLINRLTNIEKRTPMRVPSSIFVNDNDLINSFTNSIEKLSSYSLISYKDNDINLKEINKELTRRKKELFGRVDFNLEISSIQNRIGYWKTQGVNGIHLLNFGDSNSTRFKENSILDFIKENDLNSMIETSDWNKILSKNPVPTYNPSGEAIKIRENSTLVSKEFAFYERQFYGDVVETKIKPLINYRKENKVKILAVSKSTNQKEYSYIQAYGLLYSLDYIYDNDIDGTLLNNSKKYYSTPTYFGEWKSQKPEIFKESDYIYRTIENGRIVIFSNMKTSVDGYKINSEMIAWIDNTLNGSAIEEASIDPSKLSSYDVDKIVQLINSQGNIKIDPNMIDQSEGGNLPINIPASNMKMNVILAANKHNDADSTEADYLLDGSIKNLNANKVFGHISKEQMTKNVIAAINSSSERINVKNATIGDLRSSEITTEIMNATQATMTRVNITENLTAFDATFKGFLTGNNGFFQELKVVKLEVDELKAENIKVKTLEADNISSLILNAIEANIDSGIFNSIVTKALTSEIIKTELIDAVNSMIGQAVIDGALIKTASIVDAQIISLNANKINTGEIDTSKVTISGPNGHVIIKDDTIRIYDTEDSEGNRRLRIILGSLREVTQKDDFGLVVLGTDGTTRLYDHTGVYNAGIHQNAVSNEKLQEDSVDARVIKANSIFAKHIVADQILTEHLTAESVVASKIAAGTIVAGSAIIADAAIGTAQISELHGNKIIATTIETKALKANSITADKLAIGYQTNLIKNGYDSFEQFSIGTKVGTIKSGAESSVVSKDMSYSGDKSLLVRGNSLSNKIILNDFSYNMSSIVLPNEKYIVSAYVYTDSVNPVAVKLGLHFESKEEILSKEILSEDIFVNPKEFKRIYFIATIPEATNRTSMILETKSTNTNVWFDCLQIEQKQENQDSPGWWRSTEITSIDGSMIKTGYVEARRVRVGSGTIFGNGDIIDISDEGIKANGLNGYAKLGSKGLEVYGGEFYLENEGSISINGKSGINVSSAKNKIDINPNEGISITQRLNDEKIFHTTVDGELYIKGRIEVSASDTIYTKDEIDISLDEIDTSLDNIGNQIENISTNLSQKLSISVGMKLGYQDFNVSHPNKIFFCGFKTNPDTYMEEIADVDGYIKNWENNNVIKIKKQNLDLTDANYPHGYIVWDNTELTFWLVSLTEKETWQRFNKNNQKNNTPITLNESIYVLGEVDL